MKNRLLSRIAKVRKRKEKLFCAFLTLGYPDLKSTEAMIREFDRAGVDIIELGFPFSDPLADGPTIQHSSEAALRQGVKMDDAFRLVSKLRKDGVTIPVIFFGYLNPVYCYGGKRFIREAQKAGFDGVLIPDLPPEEEKEFNRECRARKFPQIYLVAPTTQKDRAVRIAKLSRGFIYYVSVRGVTGGKEAHAQELKAQVQRIRKNVKAPVLIGFGISNTEQAKALSKVSDGVIVGSAIIRLIQQSRGRCAAAHRLIADMVHAIKRK